MIADNPHEPWSANHIPTKVVQAVLGRQHAGPRWPLAASAQIYGRPSFPGFCDRGLTWI